MIKSGGPRESRAAEAPQRAARRAAADAWLSKAAQLDGEQHQPRPNPNPHHTRGLRLVSGRQPQAGGQHLNMRASASRMRRCSQQRPALHERHHSATSLLQRWAALATGQRAARRSLRPSPSNRQPSIQRGAHEKSSQDPRSARQCDERRVRIAVKVALCEAAREALRSACCRQQAILGEELHVTHQSHRLAR